MPVATQLLEELQGDTSAPVVELGQMQQMVSFLQLCAGEAPGVRLGVIDQPPDEFAGLQPPLQLILRFIDALLPQRGSGEVLVELDGELGAVADLGLD